MRLKGDRPTAPNSPRSPELLFLLTPFFALDCFLPLSPQRCHIKANLAEAVCRVLVPLTLE